MEKIPLLICKKRRNKSVNKSEYKWRTKNICSQSCVEAKKGKSQNKIINQNIQYQFLNAEQISTNRFGATSTLAQA